MKKLFCCGAMALTTLAPAVHAENIGLYLGGSLGNASLAVSGDYFDQDFGDINLDDSASAWKAIAGVQILPFISVEGSYTRFGEVDDATPQFAATLDAETIALFARGIVPFGPLQVFGKFGYHWYEADVSLDAIENTLKTGRSEDGGDVALGVGAGFELGAFTLRAEYEVFLVDDIDDLTMISVGATYSF